MNALREFEVTVYDHNNEIAQKIKEAIEWSNLSANPVTFSDIISWLRVELIQVGVTTGMKFTFDTDNRHITIYGVLGTPVAALKQVFDIEESIEVLPVHKCIKIA